MPYPALVASHGRVLVAAPGETVRAIGATDAARRLGQTPHLLLHAPLVAARLGVPECSGLDLLELLAFVHPARFAVPTAAGLARALGLEPPASLEAEALFLGRAAARLLATLADPRWWARAGAHASAVRLHRKGWSWGAEVLRRLAPPPQREADLFEVLPRIEEQPPRPQPRSVRLTEAAVRAQLQRLRGPRREPRPGQAAYATALIPAFSPRASAGVPNLVVAEAGTGTGKTLGYLAPASLYAEASGGVVWLSTYTRALQRQLRAEIDASLPARIGGRAIAVRKGRENYLCLLNLEDALSGLFGDRSAILAELVARWARFTRDGDLVGGDLPGWLPALFRSRGAIPALSDRRGECIRGACPHVRCCFIERSVHEAAEAALVVVNHALTFAVAVRSGRDLPARIVFDEGHHLFDAADSAFAVELSGAEAIELRRWILGPESPGRRAGRRRGLAARLADVASDDRATRSALEDLLEAARVLPADHWLDRLVSGEARGPIEVLLSAVRAQVLARAEEDGGGFGLEAAIGNPLPGLVAAAEAAALALRALGDAMARLRSTLAALLDARRDRLDAGGVARIAAADTGLADRIARLDSWIALLGRIGGPPDPAFVDWFAVFRSGGEERDAAIVRHWLDPMIPFARHVLAPAHGVVVTSATLSDPLAREETLAAAAGAGGLATALHLFRTESPFDYGARARVFVATDVVPRDPASLAVAFERLIAAAGGGVLGLFTAIRRLREVHARICKRLEAAGLPLYAQHVDPMDAGTLVDLFRADPRASLLGTDALRDGVDVPGVSLRLLVFETVPWSRPTILEAARRAAFGGKAWEERQVRRRLAQAFGRLIRTADDRGVFVLLGAGVPSRLLAAFPREVRVERLPLAAIVEETAAFLGDACKPAAPFLTEGGNPGSAACDG